MGGHLSSGLKRLVGRGQDLRLLMVGLSGAGKTTFLHEMKLGDVVETEPAPGLVLQTVTHKAFKTAISLTVMDIGGDTTLEPGLFGHLEEPPNGLVFVIDSSDIARLEEAKAEFDRMLACDALGDVPVLVLVSKMDTPEPRALSQLASQLGVHRITNRRWRIQPCSVTKHGIDQSIFKGLDWLAKVLRSQAKSGDSPSSDSKSGRPRAGTDASVPSDTDSTTDPEEVREDCEDFKAECGPRRSYPQASVAKSSSTPRPRRPTQEMEAGPRRRGWSWNTARSGSGLSTCT